MKKKRGTKRSLHKKAWVLFSRHVRSSKADFQGFTKCYSCGRMGHWQEMDAGHFWHSRLDFDERNIHPQCTYCNRYLHGNLGEYAIHLVKDLGVKGVEKLKKDAYDRGNDYSINELEQIIRKYTKEK